MRSWTIPRADLGEPTPGPDLALASCSRSRVPLVRQLARRVRVRLGAVGTATRSFCGLLADGRAFSEFVDDRFGVQKLGNVKPKHVRAWLEDLCSRGFARSEVEKRGDSLAALGILRSTRVRQIVSGLQRT